MTRIAARGGPGGMGRNTVTRAGGSTGEALGGKVRLTLRAGDRLRIETPGGGGFGTPESEVQ